jgi:hypothetical protein
MNNNGQAGIQGNNGQTGVQGNNGQAGVQGNNGQAGVQGNNVQAGVQGSTPALIQEAPDIKPNGKYDTPLMVYVPGGANQPNGRVIYKALEDHAIRTHHTDSKGRAATRQFDDRVFEHDANRFISDFFRHKHPNRSE